MTIVIDEANLAFTIDGRTDKDDIKKIKSTLALFTQLTKQEKKLNVVLVSSEHSFPFRLANPSLSFNIINITKFIFAGEIPPKNMYSLLTEQWSIGENLALAVMSHFGGHIYDSFLALKSLDENNEEVFLNASLYSSVRHCLQQCLGDSKKEKEMKRLLTEMAVKGFVPIQDENDPLAEIISKNNVGGVVRRDSNVIGLSKNVWDGYKYGLIPSRNSIRLVIAKILTE